MSVPVIDPRVKYVGSRKLRSLKGPELTALNDAGEILVVQEADTPVAVVIGFKAYVEMQQAIAGATKVAEGAK
jgi:hypothetical protein